MVADSAHAGKALAGLPGSVTWTTRLRSNASPYKLAPGMTSALTTVTRYGTTATVSTAVLRCLWYGVFGPRQVQVVLVQDGSKDGYDRALVTTDLDATAAQVVERYAPHRSIEVAIEDAKQLGGVGQARNRLEQAVRRTVPFGLVVDALPILWHATAGHHPGDVDAARALAQWHRQKAQPSVLDMPSSLHRVVKDIGLWHGELVNRGALFDHETATAVARPG